jgi:hypothetical protein
MGKLEYKGEHFVSTELIPSPPLHGLKVLCANRDVTAIYIENVCGLSAAKVERTYAKLKRYNVSKNDAGLNDITCSLQSV